MDIHELITYLFTPVAQIAIIIGLAEIAKKLGLKSKFIPVFDVIIGILCGVIVYGIKMDCGIVEGVIVGIALGLSACGLFSGIKNTLGGA